jgi:hypothetical protein
MAALNGDLMTRDRTCRSLPATQVALLSADAGG